MKFYLAREGVAFGPYSEFQVLESVRLGIFERNDLALAEDGKEWREVGELLPAPGSSLEERSADRPAALRAETGSLLPRDVPLDGLAEPSSGKFVRGKTALTAVRLAATLLCLLCLGAMVEHLPPPTLAESGHPAAKTLRLPLPVPIRPPVPASVRPRTALADAALAMPPLPMLVATPAVLEMPPPAPVEPAAVGEAPARRIEGRLSIQAADGLSYAPASIEIRLYPLALLKPYLQARGAEASARFEELKTQLVAAGATKERLRRASDQAFDAYINAAAGSPNRAALEQASVEAKKAREQAANAYYQLIQDRQESLSGAFYLANLPKTAEVTQTDGEGGFSFAVPEGEFAVVAGVQSSSGTADKGYYWFVPVTVGDEPKTEVLLSNDNLSSQGSVESLVQTAD